MLLTVHGDGQGTGWVSATWQDGHPVTEPVVATLTGLGRCETVLAVAPAAAPQRVTCGEPQTPAAAAPPAATDASAGDGGGAGLTPVALLATAVAGLTLLAFAARRPARRRRTPRRCALS